MSIDEVYEIIEKELKEGKTLEEIYIEYDNKFAEELEKLPREQDYEKRKEYIQIRDEAAACIAIEVLYKKGYSRVPGKGLSKWKKKEEK